MPDEPFADARNRSPVRVRTDRHRWLSAGAARRLLHQPADQVAPRLLGARLRHVSADGVVEVSITEVEAYRGRDDPAAHSFRGPTPRTQVMFGPPGHLYVYFSYGMHHCCNVVVGSSGTADAVLLRAGVVTDGVELARRRRSRTDQAMAAARLARGPACLTQALAVDRGLNGVDLLASDTRVRLLVPAETTVPAASGPRVGISVNADVEWRFWIPGDPSVSAYRRSPRAPSPPHGDPG